MIQEVIARLAASSGQMKRWTVTVVAALLSFAAAETDLRFAFVAAYIVLALATLDAYYLAQERAYRRLYDDAVHLRIPMWQMRAERVRAGDVVRAAASPSVALLYGLSLGAAIGIWLAA